MDNWKLIKHYGTPYLSNGEVEYLIERNTEACKLYLIEDEFMDERIVGHMAYDDDKDIFAGAINEEPYEELPITPELKYVKEFLANCVYQYNAMQTLMHDYIPEEKIHEVRCYQWYYRY